MKLARIHGLGIALLTAGAIAACSSAPAENTDSAGQAGTASGGGWNAGWDTPLSGHTFGSVAILQDPGSFQLFQVMPDGATQHFWPNAGSPGGWASEPLGGVVTSLAAARVYNANEQYVVGRAPDRSLWLRHNANYKWDAGWIGLGGLTNYAPTVAAPIAFAHVFVTGLDGTLFHKVGTEAGGFSAWEQLPALPGNHKIVGPPSSTVRGGLRHPSGDIDIAVLGDDSRIYHLNYHVKQTTVGKNILYVVENGTTAWDLVTPSPVGAVPGMSVAIASTDLNNLEVTAQSFGNATMMEQYSWAGGSWTRTADVAQCGANAVIATSSAEGVLDVYAIGYSDSGLYHNRYSANPSRSGGLAFCNTYCGSSGMNCCGGGSCFGGVNARDDGRNASWFEPRQCLSGECQLCGGPGQVCCAGGACATASGTTCDSTNHCAVSKAPPPPPPPPAPRPPPPPPGGVALQTATICAGDAVPTGWVVTDTDWDPISCGSPDEIVQNVWQIARVDDLPVGSTINVCIGDSPIPAGWAQVIDVAGDQGWWDPSRCGDPTQDVENVGTIYRKH